MTVLLWIGGYALSYVASYWLFRRDWIRSSITWTKGTRTKALLFCIATPIVLPLGLGFLLFSLIDHDNDEPASW